MLFTMMQNTLYKYIKLTLCIFSIWLLLWVITPMWVKYSPLHQEFAKLQELYDIPIGALYYTELPFITNTIIDLQDIWRFHH